MNIGIFGGTFNPVHIGHLFTAQFLLYEFKLNKILFIPVYIPPHKNIADNITGDLRLKMLKLAIKEIKEFEVLDVEIKRKKKSYTIHTLEQIVQKKNKYFLIIGNEWLKNFNRWYRYEKIFKYTDLLVINRKKNKNNIPIFLQKFKNQIYFSRNPIIDISSTFIRERIKNNLSIKFIVPEKVEKFIKRKKLYI